MINIKILINEKYRTKINKLVLLKKKMHAINRYVLEDVKYKLDINNPLKYYDTIWIDDTYRQYYEK